MEDKGRVDSWRVIPQELDSEHSLAAEQALRLALCAHTRKSAHTHTHTSTHTPSESLSESPFSLTHARTHTDTGPCHVLHRADTHIDLPPTHTIRKPPPRTIRNYAWRLTHAHVCTHTKTHTHTHARARVHTHTHTNHAHACTHTHNQTTTHTIRSVPPHTPCCNRVCVCGCMRSHSLSFQLTQGMIIPVAVNFSSSSWVFNVIFRVTSPLRSFVFALNRASPYRSTRCSSPGSGASGSRRPL